MTDESAVSGFAEVVGVSYHTSHITDIPQTLLLDVNETETMYERDRDLFRDRFFDIFTSL